MRKKRNLVFYFISAKQRQGTKKLMRDIGFALERLDE